jgi:hypothetical protein
VGARCSLSRAPSVVEWRCSVAALRSARMGSMLPKRPSAASTPRSACRVVEPPRPPAQGLDRWAPGRVPESRDERLRAGARGLLRRRGGAQRRTGAGGHGLGLRPVQQRLCGPGARGAGGEARRVRGRDVLPWDDRAGRREGSRATTDADCARTCPIKGSISGDKRIYYMLWQRDYARVSIDERRSERWFRDRGQEKRMG